MPIRFIKCSNTEEIGKKVSLYFINQVTHNPNSVFILATGSSPIHTYQEIIKDHQRNKTDWSQVSTFNLDEYMYLLPKYVNQSYSHFMNIHLFDHINIDKQHIHFPNPELVGDKYQQLINQIHPADICLLGVGNNGHIAFNEPGSPIGIQTHIVLLSESSRQANSRFFDNDIKNVPTHAITAGLSEILKARQIIVVAVGNVKKQAIEHLRQAKSFDSNWPITALTQHNNVIVFFADLD